MEFDEDIGHIISQAFQRKVWVCTWNFIYMYESNSFINMKDILRNMISGIECM